MATIGGTVPTLADVAARTDRSGKTVKIAEILEQDNPIIEDAAFVEANDGSTNIANLRTSLPTVYWRQFNQGIAPSKSTVAQTRDTTAMLEAWSEVDERLVEIAADGQAFRLTEGSSFLEAMSQEAAQTLIYGNGLTSPTEFTGLAARFGDIGSGAPENAQNILDAGGTGSDNTSIWLIGWGENTVHGIFPRGTQAGIKHEDYGVVTVETTAGVAGNRMRAYQERWTWDLGLAVPDWRYVVRICNIDVSNLVANSSAADIQELMQLALDRIPNPNKVRLAFYASRTLVSRAALQVRADVLSGGGITWETVNGRRMRMFQDVPVKITDSILDTEARIV